MDVKHRAVLPLMFTVLIHQAVGLDFLYHNQTAMDTFLRNITENYPDITHLYTVGQSTQGVDMQVLVVGSNPRDHIILRPLVKYVGNMHGNEVVGREILLHLIDHFTSQYGTNQTITDFLNSAAVHIMPTMNPDGFAYASEGDCDSVEGRFNANGFDLNRNFPDRFPGDAPPIQKETRVIMDWLTQYQFLLSANLHGGTLVANYPFDNYENSNAPQNVPSPDDDIFRHLSLVYSRSHHNMSLGTGCKGDEFTDGITNGAEWYPVAGGMQDYNYVDAGCFEVTLEVSCCKYPPHDQLPEFWERNRDALINYLLEVQRGVKGLITDKNRNVIPGAMMRITGRELVPFHSSKFGEFWRILLPGSYTLKVSALGYKLASQNFQVRQEEVTRLDIELELDTSNVTVTGGSVASGHTDIVGALKFWILVTVSLSLVL